MGFWREGEFPAEMAVITVEFVRENENNLY